MNVSRRRVLQLCVAAVALGGVGLGSLVHRRRLRRHVYTAPQLAEHLMETFAYLRPDAQGIDEFVALYLQHHEAAPRERTLPHVEQTFLLSTDYFQSGQPASGPIRFVALYHPYVLPCYNPLVQHDTA